MEMSGLVGPEVQPAQLGSKSVIIISPPTSNLGAALLLLLTAVVQHVAGSTEVSEPLTAGLGQALELAGPGAGGGTVVSQDIVLSQLTGSLLQVTQC